MAERSVMIGRRSGQVLVQDLGRPGYAHLGVGTSGAADRESLKLANRLVGNDESSACLEVALGGLEFETDHASWISVTGAPVPVRIGARRAWSHQALFVRAGEVVVLGIPTKGLRSYVAIRGGIDTALVLNSRSADTMSGIGGGPLEVGDRIAVGTTDTQIPGVDVIPPLQVDSGTVVLDAIPGPRTDWFTASALETLYGSEFEVTSDADRVGIRLSGPGLERRITSELASEGVVCGSLQAPPDGRLTLFLADHPVTGGYTVIAVIHAHQISAAAQLRPGQSVRFKHVAG